LSAVHTAAVRRRRTDDGVTGHPTVRAGDSDSHGPAEEEFRSSLDALDEAFFRMSAVRDASGDIVDFEYEFCNRAALGLLKLRREEVLGRRLLDLFPSHRTNGLFDAFASVTETGEPVRLEFSFEEGDVVGEFEVVVSRVGDGYVLAGHDISDRKRVERELVALKDQLQAALTSRVALEQAKGFVAAQLRMSPETAFLAIRRYARGHDMRIGDVARAVVTGEIVLSEW
jgi:PAS domain S-box-containing protein